MAGAVRGFNGYHVSPVKRNAHTRIIGHDRRLVLLHTYTVVRQRDVEMRERERERERARE